MGAGVVGAPAGSQAPKAVGGKFDRTAIKWGSLYVTVNGKLQAMNTATMTDAQIKAALGMAANKGALATGWNRLSNGQVVKTGQTTGMPAGATPPAVGPVAAAPSIDPRDGAYQNEMGRYAFERTNAINEQEARRQTLPSLYNRGAADLLTNYNRDRYDSNAELARRGIIRSGEYQRRGADRLMAQARQTADLDTQYGSGAQRDIAARLAEIQQSYNLSSAGALQSAKDRYSAANPTSTYQFATGA